MPQDKGGRTIIEVLLAAVEDDPSREWLRDETATGGGGGAVTFGDLAEGASRVAGGFAALGVGPGDRVAVSLGNRREFLLSWLAANWLGAQFVPLNTALRGREAQYILSNSGASFWVLDPELPAAELAGGKLDASTVIDPGQVLELSRSARAVDPAEALPSDIASILYTSGTTGDPKGCLCSHEYYVATGARFAENAALTPDDRLALYLPLFHMNAQTIATMGSLVSRGSVVMYDRFHATRFFQRMKNDGVTIMFYIGGIPAMLMAQPPSHHDQSHGLRLCWGGGMPREMLRPFEERFALPCTECYGMTETGLCISQSVNMAGTWPAGSCGVPLDGVDVQLLADAGPTSEYESVGELLLRGRGMFSGYHNQPDSGFDEAGWFHTGDVLGRDEDGIMYFVDRRRDIIRRAGENISAREVEVIAEQCPLVSECAVVGVPDPMRGQEVKAVVVLVAGVAPTEATRGAIDTHLRENLASFKVPREIEFRKSLPRTATQRIQKQLLI